MFSKERHEHAKKLESVRQSIVPSLGKGWRTSYLAENVYIVVLPLDLREMLVKFAGYCCVGLQAILDPMAKM